MLFLHCTRDVFIGDLARQLTTASQNKAGDRSYIREARRHILELEVIKLAAGS
jgi:hypothetical protein